MPSTPASEAAERTPSDRPRGLGRLGWVVAAFGLPAVLAAAMLDPDGAAGASSQDWPPFVLVTGLLLIGAAARDEGLFDFAGRFVARFGAGAALLGSVAIVVAVVTVTLNLDTSVTFLTPVVLAAAYRRGHDPEPFMVLVVGMSNGASLLLPGSNLTNLIVLQQSHTTGGALAARVVAAWAASAVAVVAVVTLLYRRRITEETGAPATTSTPSRIGPAALGVAGAVAAMVALPAPAAAPVVVGLGVVLAARDLFGRRSGWHELADHLNLPLLVGLFAIATALGTLGRSWSGPTHLLGHLGIWQTAGLGAAVAAGVNNLPAASLLAARPVHHAVALLIGLNLGPNLVLSGSLAGVLWFQSARAAGWSPSIRRFTLVGVVMVPATMAAALGALAATR